MRLTYLYEMTGSLGAKSQSSNPTSRLLTHIITFGTVRRGGISRMSTRRMLEAGIASSRLSTFNVARCCDRTGLLQ